MFVRQDQRKKEDDADVKQRSKPTGDAPRRRRWRQLVTKDCKTMPIIIVSVVVMIDGW